jgi:hypothetical protein
VIDQVLLVVPSWLLGGVLVVACGLASLGVTTVFRRMVVDRPGEHHNEVLGMFLSAGAVFCAVVVALAVFIVWDHQTNARQAETDEGSALIALYQDSEPLPEPDRTELQSSIRAFTASEINQEFPSLAHERSSVATERSLDRMDSAVHEDLGDTDSDATDQMTDIVQAEYQLDLASESTMPPLIWVLLLSSCVLMLLMAATLSMEHAHHHAIGTVLLGCTLGAALFLIIAADHPFAGPLGIHPTDLAQDLHMYAVMAGGGRSG